LYGKGNRHIQFSELKKYLQYRPKPKYVVLMLYPSGAKQTLDLLEQHKVQFVSLEDTIFDKEKSNIGKPGSKYKYWLGSIHHDNYKAGYDLAESLISHYNGEIKDINGVMINGQYGSESDERSRGALAYFNEHKIKIHQEINANWSKIIAYNKTEKLLNRYPSVNLIWNASDSMSIGSLTSFKKRYPNRQLTSGGFDWIKDIFKFIESGDITSSLGGHFMMGSWALITLFDHHKGHKFWYTNSEVVFDLEVIDKKNYIDYEWLKDHPRWSYFDFKTLSLLESNNKKYNFELNFLKSNKIQQVIR
jgi:hypothetical protein